ncbi:MAG: hypothetical protein EA402_13615 [Planctomycetota bacterium]|nr:MAG: hypothetical protein EA402_13615 [Planctomycetota bacterium]
MNSPAAIPPALHPTSAWRCPLCGARHRQAVEYCRRCQAPLLLLLAAQHYGPPCTQRKDAES